mgnify:CR=1 FL=1
MEIKKEGVASYVASGEKMGLLDFALHIVPSNIIDAFAKGDLLPIVFFAVLFGIALTSVGEAGREVADFLYRVQVAEQQAANGALNRLLRSFFGGRVSALAAQLLESEHLSPADLKAMKALIKKKGP